MRRREGRSRAVPRTELRAPSHRGAPAPRQARIFVPFDRLFSLMKRSVPIAILLLATQCFAQWAPQNSGTTSSLRGMSVVDGKIAWASGTRGTYLRTTDGGETWTPAQVAGAETLDFRDVQAFDASTAYLLAAGPGEASRIFKTTDGGAHWTAQYAN